MTRVTDVTDGVRAGPARSARRARTVRATLVRSSDPVGAAGRGTTAPAFPDNGRSPKAPLGAARAAPRGPISARSTVSRRQAATGDPRPRPRRDWDTPARSGSRVTPVGASSRRALPEPGHPARVARTSALPAHYRRPQERSPALLSHPDRRGRGKAPRALARRVPLGDDPTWAESVLSEARPGVAVSANRPADLRPYRPAGVLAPRMCRPPRPRGTCRGRCPARGCRRPAARGRHPSRARGKVPRRWRCPRRIPSGCVRLAHDHDVEPAHRFTRSVNHARYDGAWRDGDRTGNLVVTFYSPTLAVGNEVRAGQGPKNPLESPADLCGTVPHPEGLDTARAGPETAAARRGRRRRLPAGGRARPIRRRRSRRRRVRVVSAGATRDATPGSAASRRLRRRGGPGAWHTAGRCGRRASPGRRRPPRAPAVPARRTPSRRVASGPGSGAHPGCRRATRPRIDAAPAAGAGRTSCYETTRSRPLGSWRSSSRACAVASSAGSMTTSCCASEGSSRVSRSNRKANPAG